jgi:hypothetical protein
MIRTAKFNCVLNQVDKDLLDAQLVQVCNLVFINWLEKDLDLEHLRLQFKHFNCLPNRVIDRERLHLGLELVLV